MFLFHKEKNERSRFDGFIDCIEADPLVLLWKIQDQIISEIYYKFGLISVDFLDHF